MKLRNKKTGEIANLEGRGLLKSDNNNHIIVYPDGKLKYYTYNSLSELNSEWEDAPEEPKDYWYINCNGDVIRAVYKTEDLTRALVSIGNYFETLEQAEKAVAKLKAWKRLKDKGFRFGISGECDNTITYGITLTFSDYYDNDETKADIDLLFGGEE